MTRNRVRYYLHNLDGLKQEIADINSDLEQYRAMLTDEFILYHTTKAILKQDADRDPYLDTPDHDGSQHQKHNDHSNVESMAVSRADFIRHLEQELFEKKSIMAAVNCVLYYLDGYDRQIDRQIIQLRYKEHLPWKIVSRKIPYIDRSNILLHDKKIVDEIISNYHVRIGLN